jgi:hypothetical protein
LRPIIVSANLEERIQRAGNDSPVLLVSAETRPSVMEKRT